MVDLDANMPRYRLWNGIPDIRNRQQIAEQSASFEDLSQKKPYCCGAALGITKWMYSKLLGTARVG